ncbi:MAG: YfcE family phosphodiesterase [Sphaerochaetaceae bacterium]|nr:YfcE family phosphodiesterase [Sphaerochaetaceae bacterium]
MGKIRFFVTSDIHGSKQVASTLLKKAENAKVDGMIIAGDLCPRDMIMALELENSTFPIYLARGNCDTHWDFEDFGLKYPPIVGEVVRSDGIRIVYTHGHLLSEPEELSSFLKRDDIVITGHTHVPMLYRDKSGIIRLNPGSPARPRSSKGPTYSIIEKDVIKLFNYENGKVIESLNIRE